MENCKLFIPIIWYGQQFAAFLGGSTFLRLVNFAPLFFKFWLASHQNSHKAVIYKSRDLDKSGEEITNFSLNLFSSLSFIDFQRKSFFLLNLWDVEIDFVKCLFLFSKLDKRISNVFQVDIFASPPQRMNLGFEQPGMRTILKTRFFNQKFLDFFCLSFFFP